LIGLFFSIFLFLNSSGRFCMFYICCLKPILESKNYYIAEELQN
jgi:hypothetical protein